MKVSGKCSLNFLSEWSSIAVTYKSCYFLSDVSTGQCISEHDMLQVYSGLPAESCQVTSVEGISQDPLPICNCIYIVNRSVNMRVSCDAIDTVIQRCSYCGLLCSNRISNFSYEHTAPVFREYDQTARCHNPEDSLNVRRCQSLVACLSSRVADA
jgi:hypothetical protein